MAPAPGVSEMSTPVTTRVSQSDHVTRETVAAERHPLGAVSSPNAEQVFDGQARAGQHWHAEVDQQDFSLSRARLRQDDDVDLRGEVGRRRDRVE